MAFAKYSIQTLLVRISLLFGSIFASVITARWLGPDGAGIYALLLLLQAFAFRFANLGFGSALAFFTAKKKLSLDYAFKLVFVIGFLLAVVSCLFFLMVRKASFSPWKDIQLNLFYLAILTIPPFFWISFLRRVLSGQLKISVVNISEIVNVISRVLFLAVFVIFLKLGLLGAMTAFLTSQCLTFLYLLFQFQVKSGRVDKEEVTAEMPIRDLLRYGKWSYLVLFANLLIEELPLIILKYFSSNYIIGLFSKARSFGRHSRLVVTPFSQILFPFTAASEQDKAVQRTNTLCRNSLFVMVPFILVIGIAVKPIILILYGEAFIDSARIFYGLMPGVCVWPISQFLSVHLAASGKPRIAFLASFATLLTVIPLSGWLIPQYGAIGAAITISCIYTIRALLCIGIYLRLTGAKLVEVIIPLKTDWIYYKRVSMILYSPLARVIKAAKGM